MILGDRLRIIREAKQLSPGDVEERTGLTRTYVLRVENGHEVPSMETLEKWAEALGVQVHQLFYEGKEPPEFVNLRKGLSADDIVQGGLGKTMGMARKAH
jgi:transcriptional regulator with XRE-family HTH domain